MGMNLLPRKRFQVAKYHKISGNHLAPRDQEAVRRFWRERSAVGELNRLTRLAARHGLPYEYRVERLHGRPRR